MSDVCQYKVFSGARWDMGGHRCGKPVKGNDEGGRPVCSIHLPSAIAKRKIKLAEKHAEESKQCNAKWALEREEKRRYGCHDDLVAALTRLRDAVGVLDFGSELMMAVLNANGVLAKAEGGER